MSYKDRLRFEREKIAQENLLRKDAYPTVEKTAEVKPEQIKTPKTKKTKRLDEEAVSQPEAQLEA